MEDGQNIEVKSVSMSAFTDWVYNMLIQFFQMVQSISVPLFMVLFGIGGITLVIGALFGSSRMRGAGAGALIFGVIAYLIIQQAPAIIGVLEEFVQSGP